MNLSGGLNNVIAGQLIKSQYRGGEYRLQVRIGTSGDSEIIEARSKAAPPELLHIHLPVSG